MMTKWADSAFGLQRRKENDDVITTKAVLDLWKQSAEFNIEDRTLRA
jgi:hypothetical protein